MRCPPLPAHKGQLSWPPPRCPAYIAIPHTHNSSRIMTVTHPPPPPPPCGSRDFRWSNFYLRKHILLHAEINSCAESPLKSSQSTQYYPFTPTILPVPFSSQPKAPPPLPPKRNETLYPRSWKGRYRQNSRAGQLFSIHLEVNYSLLTARPGQMAARVNVLYMRCLWL